MYKSEDFKISILGAKRKEFTSEWSEVETKNVLQTF